MSKIYNVYCDESCHLENDEQSIMVLGSIWCPIEKVSSISKDIKNLKKKHGLATNFEIKWIKVSPAKSVFYEDIIDYFFKTDDLHFRGLIVADKSKLDHGLYNQNHNEWYYKMYFNLLKVILDLDPSAKYRIYLDIKDTQSQDKIEKLHDVLSDNLLDFSREIIERIQNVRSHETEILQVADLLIGAIAYENRNLNTSTAKQSIVKKMQDISKYSLTKSTLYREKKLNLFKWDAREINRE